MILILGSDLPNSLAHDAYKRVAAGLASRLRIAEMECRLLSSPIKDQNHLNELLAQVVTQLNTTGRCQVPVGKHCLVSSTYFLDRSRGLWINLRHDIKPCFVESSQIEGPWVFGKTDVGLAVSGLPQYDVHENDLLVRRIWHAINGHSTVQSLSTITGLSPELTRKALSLLLKTHYITKIA